MLFLEAMIAAIALVIALAFRPWRMLGGALLTPSLAILVILPWVWALPVLLAMPLQPQWSGACLVLLMLGWPLAVPVLELVAVLAVLVSPLGTADALGLAVWQGVVPATFALGLGALIRRYVGTHPFVYLLGRAFIGTALCIFVAGALSQWIGHRLPSVDGGLSLVARWIMAWGDAFVTGMLCAIFVAFKPEWVATWSDRLYLNK